MEIGSPLSPRIDRGEPLQSLRPSSISKMADIKPEATKPRIGGVYDGVPWTGGSNINKSTEPEDVLCFRPENFKEMQKQHESLKKGLPDEQKLELVDGSKTSIGLITWITWMMMLFTTKGMDTIFRILKAGDAEELDLVQNWGKATKQIVEEWVTRLRSPFGDKFDKENLRLSAFVVRGSLGPHLLARVISLAGATASGPELFLTAVFQVSYMTASLVRSVSNQIGNLKLKTMAGENVAKLGEQIVDLVKQIECSGSVPDDLLFLVSKPYVTGTQETFRTFAQQIYASIISGDFKGDYNEIIHKMNNFYQNLVQSDDYEPAKGGTKETDSSILQGMIAKLNTQMDQLKVSQNNNNGGSNSGNSGTNTRTCFKCGKEGHVKRNCPDLQNRNDEWRFKAPESGEPKEKTVDGKLYKFCEKCKQGSGFWTGNRNIHTTAEHRSPNAGQGTPSEQAPTVAGNLGVITDNPLEVDFG
jgi:hypothetical protein